MKRSKLPIDLRYLFENKYIECMQILVILFLLKQRRKGIDIDEILYYYTMLSLTTVDSKNNYYIDETYLQNNYLTYEKIIRDNVIILSNQELVEIRVEHLKKRNVMYIKITEAGKSVVSNLENNYYKKEIEKCQNIITTRKFSVKNQRKVLVRDEN
ncbi:hypothetical protein KQI42_17770 [Tissierella sp. MSJ-40]|uniref:Uncharacterized protein n=1 Tax=Tissierella simiarum TaxID=2841534 RepID=A0ABS6EAB8_9FIRM|nr:hypothetical protein [Tissierella simiarum]MBU5439867.1 hypothetical protein [Tissierella simiarum]